MTLQVKGDVTASSVATTYIVGNGSSGLSQVTDPFFAATSSSTGNTAVVGTVSDTYSIPTSSVTTYTGIDDWTLIDAATNTWEGHAYYLVNSLASATTYGVITQFGMNPPRYIRKSEGQASYSMHADIRLTFVDSIRVQPDL